MASDQLISTLRVGEARVSIVPTGAGRSIMSSWMRTPPASFAAEDLAHFEQPSPFPFQSLHVTLGSASVVVDPMDFVAYLVAVYGATPSPSHLVTPRLDQQLAGVDIPTDAITHVVITHGHDDHFIVATVEDHGGRRPLFPAARYIAERADWTPEGKQAIQASLPEHERAPELADRVMGELFRRGMVDLVAGDYEVTPGIRMLLTQGETAGHAVVRVHSASQTLYYLGDLIHHPIEVSHPDWIPMWAETAVTLASRQAVFSEAFAEDALLVASHIPGVGRLRQNSRGFLWESVG